MSLRRYLWAGALVLALAGVLVGLAPVRRINHVRKTYQAWTAGIGLPNVTIDLTDGTGVAQFSLVDNVQVTLEHPFSGDPSLYPWANIEQLSNDFRTLKISVVDGQTGGSNPNPPPSGVKVWVVVEGLGP